jgi:hypothetical protein
MVSGSRLATSWTAVLRSSVRLGSAMVFSRRRASTRSGLPSGLRKVFSTRISSITPPSRAQRLLFPRVRGRAEDPEADLAGGVAAEHRAVLHQDDLAGRRARR